MFGLSDADAHLFSFGGTQSNAMLAIAQLAHAKRVPFTYFSRGLQLRSSAELHVANEEGCAGSSKPEGNLAIALELGMQHVELSPELYQELAQTKDFMAVCGDQLRQLQHEETNANFVYIPQGAAFEQAQEGLAALAQEINEYITNEQNVDKHFSVVVPAGTGTTALYMAQHLDPSVQLFAVPCIGDAAYLKQQFLDLARRDAALSERTKTPLKLPTILTPKQKARFGRLSWPLYEIYHELLATTEIEFDLVYGCFAWHTMFDETTLAMLSKQQPIEEDAGLPNRHQDSTTASPRELLYVHTGGVSGNATMLARYQAKKMQHLAAN